MNINPKTGKKQYKSIKKMFAEMKKERKEHPIKEFFYTVQCKLEQWLIDNPRYFVDNIKYFIQRGKRGYSDDDLMDFDIYLAKVISGGTKDLIEIANAVPDELDKKFNGDDKSLKEWKRILGEISWTFKNTNKILKNTNYKDIKIPNRYNNGWRLFKKYYFYLWN